MYLLVSHRIVQLISSELQVHPWAQMLEMKSVNLTVDSKVAMLAASLAEKKVEMTAETTVDSKVDSKVTRMVDQLEPQLVASKVGLTVCRLVGLTAD
jgi:hypothetical protein